MSYDDDLEDRMAAEHQNRRRQANELEYIRRYYGLEQRHGIRVTIGGRVCSHGQEGSIVDTAGHRLMIQFDGASQPVCRQVTANMEYATADGWTAATPVPDRSANVLQGA
ncbi:hypothetical protein [Streptomyces sp. NBC_00268]|uniref:hypothetical protein n=1 Tax=Streptomyces sp. NBC_00268 TaxID=2975695 RepID=UPI00225A9FB7|nr:hypothetical protein [Streptomyces sp. NBC_00268]MCX5182621.1 hypothetical protein [Streptomyces sp. NBC_00268]